MIPNLTSFYICCPPQELFLSVQLTLYIPTFSYILFNECCSWERCKVSGTFETWNFTGTPSTPLNFLGKLKYFQYFSIKPKHLFQFYNTKFIIFKRNNWKPWTLYYIIIKMYNIIIISVYFSHGAEARILASAWARPTKIFLFPSTWCPKALWFRHFAKYIQKVWERLW